MHYNNGSSYTYVKTSLPFANKLGDDNIYIFIYKKFIFFAHKKSHHLQTYRTHYNTPKI